MLLNPIKSVITYVMRCTIWYHLYNLKNVKNTHGGVSKRKAKTRPSIDAELVDKNWKFVICKYRGSNDKSYFGYISSSYDLSFGKTLGRNSYGVGECRQKTSYNEQENQFFDLISTFLRLHLKLQ